MKLIPLSCLLFSSLLLQGCAGILVAGAATSATIVTDPRDSNQIWQDENVELTVTGIGNRVPFSHNVRVSSSAYDGTVVLMGQAPSKELMNEFVAQIQQLDGVETLHNKMKIKPTLSLSEVSRDTWITTKIKASYLKHSELSGVKIKVLTEDREVLLLGYASQDQAKIATEIASNTIGVKHVIRSFQHPLSP
ncbi:BON domain-containing protein [Vibrio sp.]|nr:BON domain-containing protein [Vibrio sp.]